MTALTPDPSRTTDARLTDTDSRYHALSVSELPSLPMLAAAFGIVFGAAVFALGTWMRRQR